jgi:ribosome-binding factor A
MSNLQSKRPRRVAELVQREVAMILQQHIGDPRLKEVHITAVQMSPDLRSARIFFTLHDLAKRSSVEKALSKAKGHIRHLLAEKVGLRYIPQLEFRYDEVLLHAEHINHLLEDITLENEERDLENKDNQDIEENKDEL